VVRIHYALPKQKYFKNFEVSDKLLNYEKYKIKFFENLEVL